MSLRVSAISNIGNAKKFMKSIQKKVPKMQPMTILQTKEAGTILVTSSLAALTGAEFLNKTNSTKYHAQDGHWENCPPLDSSDFPHQIWVPDEEPKPYIYGSGEECGEE